MKRIFQYIAGVAAVALFVLFIIFIIGQFRQASEREKQEQSSAPQTQPQPRTPDQEAAVTVEDFLFLCNDYKYEEARQRYWKSQQEFPLASLQAIQHGRYRDPVDATFDHSIYQTNIVGVDPAKKTYTVSVTDFKTGKLYITLICAPDSKSLIGYQPAPPQ